MKRKRKLGPKKWIEGAALDVMRAQLPELVKPGDWVRAGLYTDEHAGQWWKTCWFRATQNPFDWDWAKGPLTGARTSAFYWHEIDGWAPKDGFK